jgi:hypothetical protein
MPSPTAVSIRADENEQCNGWAENSSHRSADGIDRCSRTGQAVDESSGRDPQAWAATCPTIERACAIREQRARRERVHGA